MKPIRHVVALTCFFTVFSAASADETWKAGVAKVVITPPQPMWMSGYSSRDKPAEGTIHDLWAKAIVLEDSSGTRLLLVSLDLVGIDGVTSRSICERLTKAHGLSRSQIAVSTSHTHSGPVVGRNLMSMYGLDEHNHRLVDEYTTFLSDSVVSVVADAVSRLTPAVLQTGEGQATFAVNRRNNREPDVPMLRESGQLVGPVDHSAPVLAVRDPSGALKAAVFGYACHATVLSGMNWCGDWPGFAQLEIEKNHPGSVAVFWAGCGADQNPLPRRTVELAIAYGQQMAASVDRTLHSPMSKITGSLRSVYREIPLALDVLPTKEQIEDDLKSENIYVARRAAALLETLSREGKLSQSYEYPVQMWAIGDGVRMIFLGGEVVVDFSLRLKAELPGTASWVAAYSNDVMAYIPSTRVLQEGGYEGETAMIYYGLPTKWSADVEEHIVSTVKELDLELTSAAAAESPRP